MCATHKQRTGRRHLVDPHRTIQIGIRSPVQREVWDWTVSQGVTILSALEVHAQGPAAVAERSAIVTGIIASVARLTAPR